MSDRLTLASATGLPLVALAFHVAAGMTAIIAGFLAVGARKGGPWHRRAGLVFVCAMIAMGMTGAGIAIYEGKDSVGGGAFTAYLVFTAWTTINPVPGVGRRADVALMAFAFIYAVLGFAHAVTALGRPGNQIEGAPAGMLFFLATITLLAAIGDARMIRAGGLRGTRRLARHLWRMCFALFIASGSFFLGQMRFVPEPIRSVPLLVGLAVAPLVVLLYWMWRVRLRQNVRGVMIAKPIASNG